MFHNSLTSMLIPLHRYALTLPIGSNDIAIDSIANDKIASWKDSWNYSRLPVTVRLISIV